jgi:hypothetical protein
VENSETRYEKFDKGIKDQWESIQKDQSSSGGGNFVIVEASPNGYHHEIKNFTISDGCGQPNKQNDSTVAIYKGYNDCLGDTYSYSLIYKERSLATSGSDKVCSGSFIISGDRKNATLQINSSCNSTFSEF